MTCCLAIIKLQRVIIGGYSAGSLVQTVASTGRCVFDSPVSARPGGSEAVGGREKTKTENTGGPGGRQTQSQGGPRVGAQRADGPVGWSTGRIGRVSPDGVWGWLCRCLGGQNGTKTRRSHSDLTKSRACGALFLFSEQGGPGPRKGRAGEHSPGDQKRSAQWPENCFGTP